MSTPVFKLVVLDVNDTWIRLVDEYSSRELALRGARAHVKLDLLREGFRFGLFEMTAALEYTEIPIDADPDPTPAPEPADDVFGDNLDRWIYLHVDRHKPDPAPASAEMSLASARAIVDSFERSDRPFATFDERKAVKIVNDAIARGEI